MEILKTCEGFRKADDGKFKFAYVQLLLRDPKDNKQYYAKSQDRFIGESEYADDSKIYELRPINFEDLRPQLQPTWTVLTDPLDYHVKTPREWSYDADLKQRIAREVDWRISQGESASEYRRVHNDINPNDIMFKEDGTAVLIDFDSCTRIGESLASVGRTYGWYDPDVKIAEEKNDLDALRELQTWLVGESPEDYRLRPNNLF